jgi:ubiquinone/menaquinone biosynthesis C-methylase UbiE
MHKKCLGRKESGMSLFQRNALKKYTLPSDGAIYLTSLDGNQVTKVPYLLGQDAPALNRLDFQHVFLKGVLQTNHLAPIVSPKAVLDVGSGTGRWVVEVAQEFPQARVTGIDINPTTPQAAPLSAQFIQQDILKGLPFSSQSFDYLHSRFLVAAVPVVSWSELLREYMRVTRPGGWIELFEGGTTFLNVGPLTQQYLAWWELLGKQRGINASLMGQIPYLMQKIGMQNIQAQVLHVPVGKWGGRAGTMLLANLVAGWGALRSTFVSQVGIDPVLFDNTFQALPQEWEERHTVYEYVIAVCQIK